MDPILHSIAEALEAPAEKVTLLFGVYVGVQCVAMLLTGWAAYRFGPRRTLTVGLGLIVVAAGVSAFADNIDQLIINWLIQEFKKDVQSLIEQLRRGDVLEAMAKTNGRIEATEIDVSSKYAGRLATVMVNDGDDVKEGQVIARISSPEYEAQLQTAQANVLVASNTLAAAEAKIVQAKADLTYANGDLEEGIGE